MTRHTWLLRSELHQQRTEAHPNALRVDFPGGHSLQSQDNVARTSRNLACRTAWR